MPGDVAELVVLRGGDGAFHHADKAVGVGHGGLQGFFGGVAGGGHDGFVVVERNGVQNDGVNKGLVGAQQRFGTACALGAVQVDHRGTAAREGGGHFGSKGRPEPHGYSHSRTELHEVAAADALAFQTLVPVFFAQTHGNTHNSLLAKVNKACDAGSATEP